MSARKLREAIKTTPRAFENEHEYLRQYVDPVLMPLIESLLLYQPESVYHFIHDFVDESKSTRFTHRSKSVGYAKKLTTRRRMADFMSTSVIPIMDDLAKQILREKPYSVKVAARIFVELKETSKDMSNRLTATLFNVNDRVLCRFKGRPRYLPAVITEVNENGNFTVLYDDGKLESNVHSMCLKQCINDTIKDADNQEIPKATRLIDMVLLIIGVDGAGKTTLLSTLQGDLEKEHVPSAGFTSVTFQTETGSATFFDLGGGPAFRNVWKEYYADAHGVIFVVDSSSESSVLQAANVLEAAMTNELMINKPLLVFANKQDLADAIAESKMGDILRISKSFNSKIVPCVAKPAVYGRVDERLEAGLQWLFNQVHKDYDSLFERVQRDLAQKKKLDKQRRKEQRARVTRWKEERELSQMCMHDKVILGEDHVLSFIPVVEMPEDDVIYCSNCSTVPAVTKCSASKWMPVCETCATSLKKQCTLREV
ncbi:adp-ribosylation factor-like protein 13b isoform x1 [Plasmopara halstedii]|uniref:Adp-ribosylation factor-like protein 13b isoform x1 n=1 Tax=Plasmopara halstedii TaxID=4781 RepID=A0A0P1AB62_PLAHL|nr:adp-ribosylation factor-like protein 13b isoform x1 [Plasmopara halstedii]CEG37879.1 adp-ribosylation factor-like protein 13b isoform x1 [Plasmopara halstedii]|eukprot:XP_024574248.1 adp-ribosylation factor-like protein 13b isoform x1 [Plasmopara halstedii]